jgi:hypothetical protein
LTIGRITCSENIAVVFAPLQTFLVTRQNKMKRSDVKDFPRLFENYFSAMVQPIYSVPVFPTGVQTAELDLS